MSETFPMLQQLDLSRLRIDDMSPAERAELIRRYGAFIDHFRADEVPAAPAKPVRKWVPGERP
jgi:hypothetical protein